MCLLGYLSVCSLYQGQTVLKSMTNIHHKKSIFCNNSYSFLSNKPNKTKSIEIKCKLHCQACTQHVLSLVPSDQHLAENTHLPNTNTCIFPQVGVLSRICSLRLKTRNSSSSPLPPQQIPLPFTPEELQTLDTRYK